MVCEAVQLWIDLTIAYVFLSASALAFLASRFLTYFGLSLPCPCQGLFFGICSKTLCLNKLLLDFPIQKFSEVVLCVRQAHPFSGCICNRTNRVLQIDCEASSSSSISDTTRESIDNSDCSKDLIFSPEKYDIRGKAIAQRRPKSRLRLRRKQGNNGREKHLCSLPYDRNRGGEASTLSSSKLCDDYQGDRSSSADEKSAVQLLERALEEERAFRARLYMELEKERSASATAADEAMSMILRLQEEKASIEMEGRQYRRIIEEKSAYDEEEMDILVEILVRREKEKLFLEKEVEGYRRLVSVGEDFGDDDDALGNQFERSRHHGHGDLPEISMQFAKKSDSSDIIAEEEVENLSPEEKIIVTCDGTEEKPRALSLPIGLRRSSMTCGDDEVARLIGKLKFVQEDRERLISLSVKNQELGRKRGK